jgi:glycogen synthase
MTADTIGGVWTFALELARGLLPYGIEVALATMGETPGAEQRREAGALANLTLHESAFRLEWMDDPWDDVQRAGAWLLSLAAKLQPDQVHLNGYTHAALWRMAWPPRTWWRRQPGRCCRRWRTITWCCPGRE